MRFALGLGSAGASVAGSSGEEATTVESGSLVRVTYTPATDATVVGVTVDPNCSIFPPPTLAAAGAICASVSVMGQTVGASTICFANSGASLPHAYRCEKQSSCVWESSQPYVYVQSGVNYCCGAVNHGTKPEHKNVAGWDCFETTEFGAFAYGRVGDADQDGRPDLADNCPNSVNPTQRDADFDLIGDNCDNCLFVENQGQADVNHDGIGDVCEGAAGAGGAP
jgi:hypothetical protein